MDFVQIPVFGQSVKPGLGPRFRGNYWAFFERRTELSPWLALHRDSINDTELDELMLHGFELKTHSAMCYAWNTRKVYVDSQDSDHGVQSTEILNRLFNRLLLI